jgi:hypothetical protein
MILLIEENNGERWEDFHTWIAKVYDIPEENAEIVKSKYSEYLTSKMLESNIIINPHYYNIMDYSLCKNKKTHKKILKEHNIYIWIENTYGVKPLDFGVIGFGNL